MQRCQSLPCQIIMKKLWLILLGFIPVLSCTKDHNDHNWQVEVYLLSSSSLIPGQCAVNPATAVLENTAFIKNDEIVSYDMTEYKFFLSAAASQKMRALQLSAPFAVTVNKEVIYFGIIMPMTMSSTCDHSITVSPLGDQLWVRLGYPGLMTGIVIDDQRNNSKLIGALRSQGKLK